MTTGGRNPTAEAIENDKAKQSRGLATRTLESRAFKEGEVHERQEVHIDAGDLVEAERVFEPSSLSLPP
jgi:hypothetical protein